MPKNTLALKASVTRQPAAPVPPDLAERLRQLQHHEQAESQQPPDSGQQPNSEQSPALVKDAAKPKPNPHELQIGFLSRLLGKLCTIHIVNGARLNGRLLKYDQFTLLVTSMDGVESLVFKSAISSITSGSSRPPSK